MLLHSLTTPIPHCRNRFHSIYWTSFLIHEDDIVFARRLGRRPPPADRRYGGLVVYGAGQPIWKFSSL
jgi:hypothetical protein